MNPPSAIQGAMGRERKPFTYTPGGLDLSEIKSERMAKRLMRNAMNQGVPEQPPQPAQSPITPSTPIAVPNFNCLPVQVFPTFNLPANPKSLLRTRSTPDKSRDPPQLKVPPPSQPVNNYKPSGMEHLRETINNNTGSYSHVNNNSYNNSRPISMYENNTNRPVSMFEYSTPTPASNTHSLPRTSYGSDAYMVPVLPEISYDAEFLTAVPRKVDAQSNLSNILLSNESNSSVIKETESAATNFTIKPLSETHVPIETKPVEESDATDDNDEQREVKVVKKQVRKEKKIETQNGEQNGDNETEMVVKLPAKKVAPKVETKVEVVKKTLPDGSVEEIKTTTTKTTIDGRTEIKTRTETTTIPKEQEEVEEVEEEEEEEEEIVEETEENAEDEVVEEPTTVVVKKSVKQEPVETSKVVKKEERTETTTTKKVVVVQQSEKNEEEEEEEDVEEEEEVEEESEPVVVKQPAEKPQSVQKQESKQEEVQVVEERKEVVQNVQTEKHDVEEEEEEEEEEVEEVEVDEKKEVKVDAPKKAPAKEEVVEEEEEVEEEEFEEAEEHEKSQPKPEQPAEPSKLTESKEQQEADEESEYTEEEIESEKEDPPKDVPAATPETNPEPEKVEQTSEQKKEEPVEQPAATSAPEQKVPLREPSIPLEKVEDVEIKPIGGTHESVSKTTTSSTEIISGGNDKPAGTLTEYNRYENIVTVNRTTKTLDHSYEQLTQQGIPTVKTYFPPPDRERVSISPSKVYQPTQVYPPSHPQPQQQQERRHSLLLERLSCERQMPSDLYHNQNYQYNQTHDQQRQWSQEPQSEVVNVSNVKPSSITNQQWYQQSRKENVIFNNITPSTPAASSQQWNQPQAQPQTPPHAQSHAQPHTQPQVQHQLPSQPQPQFQPSYNESLQNNSRISSNTYQQSSYPSYTPTPTNWATSPSANTQPNQYSLLNRDSTESYQKSSQQYSSSYVPPPWEQDPNYVAPPLENQNFYQQPPPSNTFSPTPNSGWNPKPSTGKFSKPISTAYVPPAPNQSFVKPVSTTDLPNQPGRKTYYSEYERRYITVPESTYIPSETKYQPQPDPSPQYYYDNNEPSESVEPAWRKELREFTEKTTQQTEMSSVRPPWEEDPKYAKVPTASHNPMPSWSQTLRPQSYRERSFEAEFVGSNDWSKTNTLGRGRPLSSYGNSNVDAPVPERARGVSVDRYNPNYYQSPPNASEHGPVQSHTLNPTPPAAKGYHNPNVPAYHARASAEPREQQLSTNPRNWGDSRHSPIQSRSFKYLQWITGTEN